MPIDIPGLAMEQARQLLQTFKEQLETINNQITEVQNRLARLNQDKAKIEGVVLALSPVVQSAGEEGAKQDTTLCDSHTKTGDISGASDPQETLLFDLDFGSTRSSKSSPSNPVLKLVHEILSQAPAGLHYLQVYSLLLQKGVTVPGQRPENNLATYMSRDRMLQRVGRGVYKLLTDDDERGS